MLSTLFCCIPKDTSNVESHKCKYCGVKYFFYDDLVYHIKYYHIDKEEETLLLNKSIKL